MAEEKMLRKLGPYTVAVDLKPVKDEVNQVRKELDAMINDSATSTESTWSSQQIQNKIDSIDVTDINDSATSAESTWSSSKIQEKIDAIDVTDINDAATSTESTWSSEKIGNEIDKANTVAISDTEPTNENVAVWIKKNNSSSINLPEIDDASVSEVDTWSSKKISEELAAVQAGITGILEGSF